MSTAKASRLSNFGHTVAPWALPVLLLAVWQLSVSAGWLSTRILPAPSAVIEAGISLFLMLFFIYFYCHIDQWVIETLPSTISPAFFPSVVTLVLIIMSALLTGFCLRSVRHMLAGKVDEERLELQEGGEEAGRFAALAGYVGILFLYLIGLHFIGFVYSTPIVMFLVSLMLGLRHWLISIVCYVLFTLLLNYVAFNFMQIILPTGVLFG